MTSKVIRLSGLLALMFCSGNVPAVNGSPLLCQPFTYPCCSELVRPPPAAPITLQATTPIVGLEGAELRLEPVKREFGAQRTDLLLTSTHGPQNVIRWRFRDFYSQLLEPPAGTIYFVPNADLAIIPRELSGGRAPRLSLEIWQRKDDEFTHRMNVGPMAGSQILVDYSPDHSLLALGTDAGSFFILNTRRFWLVAALTPPALEAPEPALSVGIAPDATGVVTFHQHRIVTYRIPVNVKGLDAAFLHPNVYTLTADLTATAFGQDVLWVGDSQGGLAAIDAKLHRPTLKLNLGASYPGAIVGIYPVDGVPMVSVAREGFPDLFHLSTDLRGRVLGRSHVHPRYCRKGTRYSLENILEDIYLNWDICIEEYNLTRAVRELRLGRRELEDRLLGISIALTQPEVAGPTRSEAYQILRYAIKSKSNLWELLKYLREYGVGLAQILQRPKVYGAAAYLMAVAQERDSNVEGYLTMAERKLREMSESVAQFQQSVPPEIREKTRTLGLEMPADFWLSLTKIQNDNPGEESLYWSLLALLLSQHHPVENSRRLSEAEIVEALDVILYYDRNYGNHTLTSCLSMLGRVRQVIWYMQRPGMNESFMDFRQASELLRMAQLDGMEWSRWADERDLSHAKYQLFGFEEFIARLKSTWREERRKRGLPTPADP